MEKLKKYVNSLNKKQLIVLKYMINTKEGQEILTWYFHNSRTKQKSLNKK